MEKELEVEVKIISEETVKPSVPPPSHPTTFELSFLDQMFGSFHSTLFLFYTAPTPQCKVDINGLKTSLSQTLDKFHPLAGRLLDETTVSCNHQGTPFIEAEVNCNLLDVLKSPHKLKMLTKFLPPQKFQACGTQPLLELVPLALQINIFLCGGVVIGLYSLHKLLDAVSSGTFFNYWSALASKRFDDLVQPDFEATVKAFPPLPKEKVNVLPCDEILLDPSPRQSNNPVVIESFVLGNDAISKLKARATGEQVPEPTRFEAVAGFIWEHALSAACNSGVQVDHTMLLVIVNMRPRMSPPLPRGSMGNIITSTRAHAEKSSRLQGFVTSIHSALSKANHEITTTFSQREKASEIFWSKRKADWQLGTKPTEGIYALSSLCKSGLEEADFGFGKPVWIVPTDGRQPPPTARNMIYFTDYRHPITGKEGIEAWLLLEEKQMQVLKSNPTFLAYASQFS